MKNGHLETQAVYETWVVDLKIPQPATGWGILLSAQENRPK
jgi:hypothetical protein